MSSLRALLIAAVVAVVLPLPAVANAASSGLVTGKAQFFQHQGNFCPTPGNCTGARYPQSEYHTYQPVRNSLILLVTDVGSVPLGFGTTDDNGDFSISWFANGGAPKARLVWSGQHKDGRFYFFGPAGGTYKFKSQPITLVSGTTASSPQNVGSRKWGNLANPLQTFNAYDGAERMWRKTLATSNLMVAEFTGVEIYGFSNTSPRVCKTSCADGANKFIQLDAKAAFSPQARVMHEMGHIASYLANPRDKLSDYCYPNLGDDGCTWKATTPEWQSGAFEEALATFLADTALWAPSSVLPRSCLSAVACVGGNSLIETSKGPATGCGWEEFRWPLSTQRYLWDIYDSLDDGKDPFNRPRYEVIDTIASYPSGYGDHETEEPFKLFIVDAPDGASGLDFVWNYWKESGYGVNTWDILQNNCSPL